jgi:hypothetical protein
MFSWNDMVVYCQDEGFPVTFLIGTLLPVSSLAMSSSRLHRRLLAHSLFQHNCHVGIENEQGVSGAVGEGLILPQSLLLLHDHLRWSLYSPHF